jgi:hypothetical protein
MTSVKEKEVNWTDTLFKQVQGESTLSPPKIVITSMIFQQFIYWVMYGHHILDYFYLF